MGCKSSTLIYSDTGNGKTNFAGWWARYIASITGKRVRIYTAEPGGLDTISDVIAEKIVDVWDISTRPYQSETIDFAAKGYWPDPNDAKRLVAPSEATFQEFGGFIYEGATAFGELLLDELSVKGAANEIIGAEKAPQQYVSGSLRVAGNNQTHYGIAQSRARKAISDSHRLPVHLLWSARELKVKDEDDPRKQYVFGPLLAGSARTLDVPAWFGHTLHLAVKKVGPKLVRRLYTTKHFDEGSEVPYLAQVRVPAVVSSQIKEYYDLDPDGKTVLEFLDKLIPKKG